ncbi:FxsA family protein [Niallia taxi]|nr:FxsA family protein [Niallia taxi]MDE5052309.1 FxsA family protein [Niallia taxi]
MRNLFIALLIVPLDELAAFLLSGKLIGIPETLILVVVPSELGAFILKKEGVKAIRNVQERLSHGSLPGDANLNGLSVLIGGNFMLLPGIPSDIVGALLLLPPPRKLCKKLLLHYMQKKLLQKNGIIIHQ